MYSIKWLFICLILLCSSSSFAREVDHWQFVLTPVLWNPSVEATLSDSNSGGGDLPVKPDYSFFTLDNLNDYMALQFEANHGRFGILFDGLKARYQDETGTSPVNFIIGTELGFTELSARYQLLKEHELDLIGGVRRVFLDIDMTLVPATAIQRSFDWTDPLIGLRYHYPLTHKWHTWVRGDIGGFDVSTQRVINFIANMQYLMNSNISFTIGYRYLQIDFKQDDFLYDVTLNGIQLAVGIHF